jgi:Zn-dependent protease
MPEQRRNGTGGAGLGPGILIGRIAGIDIRLHWTWGVAAVVIALWLAHGVFPGEVGGLSSGSYLAMGIATTLLFFVSLLLHELGHALEARREGLPTRGITLWMLGGVAQSGAPFPRAGVEARVALAGPAVSAVLGVALVAAGRLAGVPVGLAAVLEWLGWTNLLLLAFNMLPAFPLDGGRVLRAALWQRMGSLLRATRAAARVSQALSVVLIAVGVFAALFLGAFSGLWLAFVGWFVLSAGAAELAATEAQATLTGVQVEDRVPRRSRSRPTPRSSPPSRR